MREFNADKFIAWVESQSKKGTWVQRFEGDNGIKEAYEYADKLRSMIGDSGVATVISESNKVTVQLVKAGVES